MCVFVCTHVYAHVCMKVHSCAWASVKMNDKVSLNVTQD